MKLYSHLIVVLPVLLAFAATQEKTDMLAQVGTTSITKKHLDEFSRVSRIYPAQPNEYFPGKRTNVTFQIETEILAAKATPELKDKIKAEDDWQWKKRYYPAQLYLFDVLVPQFGIMDSDLKKYYNAHRESFKDTIKAADSTKKDSVYVRSFEDEKLQIAVKLFLENNKPDSAFLKSLGDTLPPQEKINQLWLNNVRNNPPLYFMKKFYTEATGKPFPDSMNEYFGEGKLITPKDFDVIKNWIPEERRDYYSQSNGKKELVEWLLKWKLFSDQAQKSGFTKQSEIKGALDWAWKIEVVFTYINNVLEPKVKLTGAIDTTLLAYAFGDDMGTSKKALDSAEISTRIAAINKQRVSSAIDSMIYSFRKKVTVKFYQKDWRDDKNMSPAKLIAKADSLRDSAKASDAEQIYNTLVNDYSFSPEGKRAIIELAKLQTERQAYYQAINNYKKYLQYGDDKSKLCNVFFMIGFIYDEYLDKPSYAEQSYKYVLKNLPGCELTDDAEFMMLHLGEPMSSIEELQAEALRQGRKVENADQAETVEPATSEKAAPAKKESAKPADKSQSSKPAAAKEAAVKDTVAKTAPVKVAVAKDTAKKAAADKVQPAKKDSVKAPAAIKDTVKAAPAKAAAVKDTAKKAAADKVQPAKKDSVKATAATKDTVKAAPAKAAAVKDTAKKAAAEKVQPAKKDSVKAPAATKDTVKAAPAKAAAVKDTAKKAAAEKVQPAKKDSVKATAAIKDSVKAAPAKAAAVKDTATKAAQVKAPAVKKDSVKVAPVKGAAVKDTAKAAK